MQVEGIIEALPLWATLHHHCGDCFALGRRPGWRLGNYMRSARKHEKDAPVGAVVAATLAWLAFLLAFTFGMAASRYDARSS